MTARRLTRLLIVLLASKQVSIAAPRPAAIKGVALADWAYKEPDLAALDASWYYGWSEACAATDSRCVNMVRQMQMPAYCYPVLLVGNEPDQVEPWGHPVAPAEAAIRVQAIEAACPDTRLVVGNAYPLWLEAFLDAYPTYSGALGLHLYCGYEANNCIAWARYARALTANEMWVTEWNCLYCDAAEFKALLMELSYNFARIAPFTNRQPPEAYEQGWGLRGADLVNADGTLTANGQVYADWRPAGVWRAWLPAVGAGAGYP